MKQGARIFILAEKLPPEAPEGATGGTVQIGTTVAVPRANAVLTMASATARS